MPDTGRDIREVVVEQKERLEEVRGKIGDVRHDLANHQQKVEYQLQLLDQTAEARHNKLAESFMELKNALKWGLGLLVSVIMSFMFWAVAQQFNANDAQKKDMQAQIELLKAQDASRAQYRQEVLSRLPPGAAETSGTPVSK